MSEINPNFFILLRGSWFFIYLPFYFMLTINFLFTIFFFCFCCMVGKSKGIEKTQGFTKGGGSQTSGSNDSIICNILVVLVIIAALSCAAFFICMMMMLMKGMNNKQFSACLF